MQLGVCFCHSSDVQRVPVKCESRGEEESLVLGENGDPAAKPGSSRVTPRAGNHWVQREGG